MRLASLRGLQLLLQSLPSSQFSQLRKVKTWGNSQADIVASLTQDNNSYKLAVSDLQSAVTQLRADLGFAHQSTDTAKAETSSVNKALQDSQQRLEEMKRSLQEVTSEVEAVLQWLQRSEQHVRSGEEDSLPSPPSLALLSLSSLTSCVLNILILSSGGSTIVLSSEDVQRASGVSSLETLRLALREEKERVNDLQGKFAESMLAQEHLNNEIIEYQERLAHLNQRYQHSQRALHALQRQQQPLRADTSALGAPTASDTPSSSPSGSSDSDPSATGCASSASERVDVGLQVELADPEQEEYLADLEALQLSLRNQVRSDSEKLVLQEIALATHADRLAELKAEVAKAEGIISERDDELSTLRVALREAQAASDLAHARITEMAAREAELSSQLSAASGLVNGLREDVTRLQQSNESLVDALAASKRSFSEVWTARDAAEVCVGACVVSVSFIVYFYAIHPRWFVWT